MADADSAVATRSTTPLDGEEEDRIFTGRTFYVSHNVPSRDHFCNIITANGGLVSQVDSKAEFIIVDHLKAATYRTPVYSYKFLEDCSKNKRLEDIEKYLVGKEPKQAPTAGTAPAPAPRKFRGGRVPFTDEDDQILLNWINRPQIALSGNKVYKELEARYPHHTYHAWRGRWVDQLSKTMPDGPKPTRTINFDDNEVQSDEEPRFTRADDEILMGMKDEIIHAANEKAVYRKIQRKHPHHSDIQWRNRFTTVLLPMINKKEVEKTPVQEGEAEDVSPRSSEVLPEEQPDPHVPEAIEAAEQQPAEETPPPVPIGEGKKTQNRRASDQAVDYSQMGQAPSSRELSIKAHKTRHSLPAEETADPTLPPGDDSTDSILLPGEVEKIHTPTHHETQLLQPPRSPKGHPTRDVTISPRVKSESEPSPAQQLVRVQQWRTDVSRHKKANDDDQALLSQLRNEITDVSPLLPSNAEFQPGSPSSAIDRVVDNKRKRTVDPEPVTPKNLSLKRLKIVKRIEAEILSTPEPENTANTALHAPFPSTPPSPPPAVTTSGVRKRSPAFSDFDSVIPAPPISSRIVSSAVKVNTSYQEMSTQALYDNLPEQDEDILMNGDIPGLEDVVEEEAEEDEKEEEDDDDFAPPKFKDEDVFVSTAKGKGRESQGGNGTIDFETAQEAFDEQDSGDEEEDESEEFDEETAQEQEEEVANYLAETAAKFGVGQKEVIEAIERTSGERALVDVVLTWRLKGKGLPKKIAGVWTPEEDKILMESDGKLIMELERKHGERILERMDWLKKWQDA